jgi:retron-type reverse transcriptase
MLALLVLEPEWEAKFEKNSYGLRATRFIEKTGATCLVDQ